MSNEKVINKFQEISGIEFSEVEKASHNIKLATFDKFSVTDEINLKLLAIQGVNHEYVKLQSARKTTDGQKVFLFMVKNGTPKSFYSCYVEKISNKMPTVKNQENISIAPLKADNTRVQEKQVVSENFVTKKEYDELQKKLDFLISSMVEKKVTESNKKTVKPLLAESYRI